MPLIMFHQLRYLRQSTEVFLWQKSNSWLQIHLCSHSLYQPVTLWDCTSANTSYWGILKVATESGFFALHSEILCNESDKLIQICIQSATWQQVWYQIVNQISISSTRAAHKTSIHTDLIQYMCLLTWYCSDGTGVLIQFVVLLLALYWDFFLKFCSL